ncbi:MAG: hypothetical protein NC127_00560 [Muribaculum sp.]|nr:hypothetical protein [Muribaculum sp.]
MVEKVKSEIYLLVIVMLSLGVALSGCNSDIFIDPISADVAALSLDGNGDEHDVHISKGEISNVALYTWDERRLTQEIYNAEGELQSGFVTDNLEIGFKGVWYDEYLHFSIERVSERVGRIVVEKNDYDTPYEFTLMVSNGIKSVSVDVKIMPGARYVVDRVECPGTSRRVYEEHRYLLRSWQVDNDTDEPMKVSLDLDEMPIIGKYRFDSEWVNLFMLFEDGAGEADVPSFRDYMMGQYGVKAPFCAAYNTVSLVELPNRLSDPTVAPHTSEKFSLYVDIEDVGVAANIYGHNPENGRELMVDGEVRAILPTAIYLKREEVVNE